MAIPKTLATAVQETLQVYGAAAILTVFFIIFIPSWLCWTICYLCSAVYLTRVFGYIIESWKPRSRVSASDKAVFVTGCDSGFGHLLAQRLDDLGLVVFAGCLLPDGDGAKTLKKTASDRLHVIPLDVTQDDSVGKALQLVTDKLEDNKLWAVVNNAGIYDGAELIWTNIDIVKKVIDVNTYSVVNVTKAFLPLLCKQKGRVVTMCSVASRTSFPCMVPYCMSKHATLSFCDGLRLEMYRFGVQLITVEPYGYNTELLNKELGRQRFSEMWDQTPLEVKELFPEGYLQRYMSANSTNASFSDKLHQVVDCLEEAIMASHPRNSYHPGPVVSKALMWLVKGLPKDIEDLLMYDRCYRDI